MESNNAPPVNVAEFRETMREGGIEEIVEPMLLLYVQEAERVFEKLLAALQRGDHDAARSYAHAMKSSSLNIRASKLAGLLEELESAIGAGASEIPNEIFGRVRPEYEAVIAYLVALRRSEVP